MLKDVLNLLHDDGDSKPVDKTIRCKVEYYCRLN